MQSPNTNRSVISGRARSLVSPDGTTNDLPSSSGSDLNGERSGSRDQLDRSFRRITLVGAHQSSLRRGGAPNRLN